MATKNDITGDPLVSKSPTEAYRDGWDRIFGKKEKETPQDLRVLQGLDLHPSFYPLLYRENAAADE